MENKLYLYDGPVMSFGKVIQDRWNRGTQACSEKKALSNLTFSYKMRKKMSPNTMVNLDPRYLKVEE